MLMLEIGKGHHDGGLYTHRVPLFSSMLRLLFLEDRAESHCLTLV